MNYDISKELQNMFIVESYTRNVGDIESFLEGIETLDNPTGFPVEAIPIFENYIKGKKVLTVDMYDLFRYATANSRDEDLNISKCFEKICMANDIDADGYDGFAVTIPKAQVRLLNEAANKIAYTKLPQKLGQLGRFMDYLKFECINKGIKLVKEK